MTERLGLAGDLMKKREPIEGLSQRLKEARERTGISQSEVARRLKCTRSSVSQWEDGTNEPRAARLRQLAQLYSVSHEWLATGSADLIRDVTLIASDEAKTRHDLRVTDKKMSLWRLETEMMAGWHLHRGDVVVVERVRSRDDAKDRDVVIVEYENRAYLIRVYFPPYLYALPLGAQPAPLRADQDDIRIIGVVRRVSRISDVGLGEGQT